MRKCSSIAGQSHVAVEMNFSVPGGTTTPMPAAKNIVRDRIANEEIDEINAPSIHLSPSTSMAYSREFLCGRPIMSNIISVVDVRRQNLPLAVGRKVSEPISRTLAHMLGYGF